MLTRGVTLNTYTIPEILYAISSHKGSSLVYALESTSYITKLSSLSLIGKRLENCSRKIFTTRVK